MPTKQSAPEIELGNIVLLPPDVLTPMPNQPRKEFDTDTIRGIAESAISLRSRGLGKLRTGFTDVLTVRLPPGALDKNGRLKDDILLPIVSGETRWRAALWANERQSHSIPELPCAIENVGDEDALELAYFANAHRHDLSPQDEAEFLLLWKNRQSLTLRQLANKTGKTLGYIQNRMDVISAAPDVLSIFDERPKALMIVRRIDTVNDPKFRKELIKEAKAGATHAKIEERIKAHNSGISVPELQARREIGHYEKKYDKEVANASKTAMSERTLSDQLLAVLSQTQNALEAARHESHGATFSARERRELLAQIKKIKKAVDGFSNVLESTDT